MKYYYLDIHVVFEKIRYSKKIWLEREFLNTASKKDTVPHSGDGRLSIHEGASKAMPFLILGVPLPDLSYIRPISSRYKGWAHGYVPWSLESQHLASG